MRAYGAGVSVQYEASAIAVNFDFVTGKPMQGDELYWLVQEITKKSAFCLCCYLY